MLRHPTNLCFQYHRHVTLCIIKYLKSNPMWKQMICQFFVAMFSAKVLPMSCIILQPKDFLVSIGPSSSIGSPMMLIMRPNVCSPTGTVIGAPVSSTCWPLVRPSVPSIAMVLTMFSPKCWATSKTRRCSKPCTSKAFKMGGNAVSNCTSTTAPITWETLPTLAADAFLASAAKLRHGHWSLAPRLARKVLMAPLFCWLLQSLGQCMTCTMDHNGSTWSSYTSPMSPVMSNSFQRKIKICQSIVLAGTSQSCHHEPILRESYTLCTSPTWLMRSLNSALEFWNSPLPGLPKIAPLCIFAFPVSSVGFFGTTTWNDQIPWYCAT